MSDITVVESASFVAAPSCTLYLAQLGARVVRIDQIGGGPDAHRWPRSSNGESFYWEGLNKGKMSISIDLRQLAGQEIAQRLAVSEDGVFVTNFPADGFLAYEKLTALRSDQICLRVMGWGDAAPAVDYTINAAVGLPYLTGHPDDQRPVNHILPAWDLITGAYGAFSLLAACNERTATGKGRELRLSLSDVAASTLGNLGMLAEAILLGEREKSGNNLYGAFGRDFVLADNERIMLVAITVKQWRNLLTALDIGSAVAALECRLGCSFSKNEGLRYVHRDAINVLIADALSRRPLQSWEPVFKRYGLCWAKYDTLAKAIRCDPRIVSENPIFTEVNHPSGSYPTPSMPVRSSDERCSYIQAAPRIGDHTDEVLEIMLGMSIQEIGKLHDVGIVQ